MLTVGGFWVWFLFLRLLLVGCFVFSLCFAAVFAFVLFLACVCGFPGVCGFNVMMWHFWFWIVSLLIVFPTFAFVSIVYCWVVGFS